MVYVRRGGGYRCEMAKALLLLAVFSVACAGTPAQPPPRYTPEEEPEPQVRETLAPTCLNCDAAKQATYDAFARRRAEEIERLKKEKAAESSP